MLFQNNAQSPAFLTAVTINQPNSIISYCAVVAIPRKLSTYGKK